MKTGKKAIVAAALVGGLLATPGPAYAYREFWDHGMPHTETVYVNDEMNYEMAMPITVHADGRYVPSDVDSMIRSGRTLVPLRAAGQAVGTFVDWDQASQTAIARKGSRTVTFTVGSNTYYVDGVANYTDVAPFIMNGRTMLPLRALGEALDCKIDWDQDLYDVEIDTAVVDTEKPTIPNNLPAEVQMYYEKYYVPEDPSDPILGTWLRKTYDTIHGDGIDCLFVSRYNGEYHVIEAQFTDVPSGTELDAYIKRTKDFAYYQNEIEIEDGDLEGVVGLPGESYGPSYYDLIVLNTESERLFTRGPNMGMPADLFLYVRVSDRLYSVGQVDPITGNYDIEWSDEEPYLKM